MTRTAQHPATDPPPLAPTVAAGEAAAEFDRAGYAVLHGAGADEADLRTVIGATCRPRGGTFWSEIQTVEFRLGTDPADSVAESEFALSAHTDGSFEPDPPEVLLLQCVCPDEPGYGESRVVTAEDLITRLPAGTAAVLARPDFRFSRRRAQRAAEATSWVLRRDPRGAARVRFRHDEAYRIEAASPEGAAAVEELCVLLRNENVQRPAPLERGDVLWLDNTRVLHARTALSGRVVRRLRAAWGDAPARAEAL